MGSKSQQNGFLFALLATALCGCSSTSSRLPYAHDPVLLGKKPVEGKLSEPALTRVAQIDPSPPPLPAIAFVNPPSRGGSMNLDTPALVEKPPAVKTPTLAVARPVPAHQVPAQLAVRRKVPYGHASNYSWLQGVVKRTESGDWELVYGELAAGPWGDKVRLEEHEALARLHAGDIIRVEGEFLVNGYPVPGEPQKTYPSFRIRTLNAMQPDS